MSATTCDTCGLPDELCVCTDVERMQTEVTIRTDRRRYDKAVTIVEGVETDRGDLASALKSQMACGGTVKDGHIELQGDHVDRVAAELDTRGYSVVVE
jgi:translation initiation factor 1